MLKILKNIEKRFPIGLFALLLAIIALYPIFHRDKPDISYERIAEVDVFDVHQPLEELTVLFNNEDIGRRNLNLRFITLNVKNDGDLNIQQSQYDKDDIWGIRVKNGRFIKVRLMDTNSYDYIKHTINPRIVGDNLIEFSKIHFDKDKYFTIEILILHNKEVGPALSPVGKISGIDNSQIKSLIHKPRKTFWQQVIAGNILIHIIRFYFYIIFISILTILFIPIIGLFKWLRFKMIRK